MALTDKLRAIADAIRGKTGGTEEMTLDQMAVEIAGIESGGGDPNENLVKYVTNTLASFDDDSVTNWVLNPVIDYVRLAGITTIGNNWQPKNMKILVLPNVTSVGISSLYGMSQLVELHMPKVKSFGVNCVGNLANLIKADFGSLEITGNYLCGWAPKLEALIIRTDAVCPNAGGNVLKNSGVANGTGFIYVPKTLIEEYKVATNWAVYADQFRAIEDYPEICGEVLA